MFVDIEAEQASSDEEIESGDEEAEIKNHDNQFYKEEELTRKFDPKQKFKQIEERAAMEGYGEGSDEEGEGFEDEDMEEDLDRIGL